MSVEFLAKARTEIKKAPTLLLHDTSREVKREGGKRVEGGRREGEGREAGGGREKGEVSKGGSKGGKEGGRGSECKRSRRRHSQRVQYEFPYYSFSGGGGQGAIRARGVCITPCCVGCAARPAVLSMLQIERTTLEKRR